jgi:GNAT superfamily N-acetyltransferase
MITPLGKEDISTVSSLTFPAYRSLLEQSIADNKSEEKIIALVARSAGTPVGLVLARYSVTGGRSPDAEHPQQLALLSVMTDLLWRWCGVATLLLQALAEEGGRLGHQRLTVGYTTKMESLAAFERLLASAGWSAPQPSMHLSLFRVSDMQKASWQVFVLSRPQGYELFPLSELRDEESVRLKAGVAAGDIPEGLSPFADEEYLVPEVSVGVRSGKDVVAWMTLIRSPFISDALCYRSLFVHPAMRTANGFGALVAREAFYLHAASHIRKERPNGVFGTSYSATKQLNFARKRLFPYCYEIYESRRATLLLQNEASTPMKETITL